MEPQVADDEEPIERAPCTGVNEFGGVTLGECSADDDDEVTGDARV